MPDLIVFLFHIHHKLSLGVVCDSFKVNSFVATSSSSVNPTTSNNLTSYDEVEKGFRVHEEDEAVELNESLNEFNNESRFGVGRDVSDVGEAQEEDDDNNKNMEFKFDLDLTTINVGESLEKCDKEMKALYQDIYPIGEVNDQYLQYLSIFSKKLDIFKHKKAKVYLPIIPLNTS
ncbi:hypothetical protein DICPUDRAFT_85580 [Dictyostelium purpureum]|uniref:Uncharacterized protein n=1 Tax=Dictyostelium purpureum TaxID=5786 RepID=F1A664_DICPU|nr:uncharacterized protein DICPUDRAFT_85580 [Dictyostelium purpureum]EGC28316.1 hypothetical protein DICPUDRAFT_85580 [Dictyostelium purpureum]|eukprot:XP_003295158.1 hypothetical protein DICPUDRAFT_85580 [Dictyostelium purpureum]